MQAIDEEEEVHMTSDPGRPETLFLLGPGTCGNDDSRAAGYSYSYSPVLVQSRTGSSTGTRTRTVIR